MLFMPTDSYYYINDDDLANSIAYLKTVPAVDAVMLLRVQAERMTGGFFPSAREYSIAYGLNEARLRLLPEHAVVLHPGPMLRGMEIASAVADSDSAAITQQVANGVHIRMAVLYHLLAHEEETA